MLYENIFKACSTFYSPACRNHIFEIFEMDDKLLIDNAAKYEGKSMRMIALIKDIKTGGYTMPRLEITYKSTEIWDMQEE